MEDEEKVIEQLYDIVVNSPVGYEIFRDAIRELENNGVKAAQAIIDAAVDWDVV